MAGVRHGILFSVMLHIEPRDSSMLHPELHLQPLPRESLHTRSSAKVFKQGGPSVPQPTQSSKQCTSSPAFIKDLLCQAVF